MLQPNSGRNELGKFVAGNALAANHRPYRYSARAAQIEEEMTAEEILALNNDDKALGKRPAIDTIVIRRLARAMKKMEPETCADVDRAIEGHLDRVEGKSLQAMQHSGMIVSATVKLDDKQRENLVDACKLYIEKRGD